jgi:hypothetical protein
MKDIYSTILLLILISRSVVVCDVMLTYLLKLLLLFDLKL